MSTRLTPEEEARLVALARAGDRSAESRLVLAHLAPAYALVNRFAERTRVPKEDLRQEAALAVVRAVRKFDASRGVRLVTYAMWWVRHRLLSASRRWHHLSQEPPDGGGRWLDTMPQPEPPPPPFGIDLEMLDELTPKRRAVVELLAGLNGHRPHTRQEVAAALGIGLEAAHQLCGRALDQLRWLARLRGARPGRAA